nr:hypothetical protein [Chromobacterium sinusclupearum]
MARFRRDRLLGGCYFFTVVTERWQRILLEPDVRGALREAILAVRRERPFAIDA